MALLGFAECQYGILTIPPELNRRDETTLGIRKPADRHVGLVMML